LARAKPNFLLTAVRRDDQDEFAVQHEIAPAERRAAAVALLANWLTVVTVLGICLYGTRPSCAARAQRDDLCASAFSKHLAKIAVGSQSLISMESTIGSKGRDFVSSIGFPFDDTPRLRVQTVEEVGKLLWKIGPDPIR
jgi:hypothetical protein